MSLYIPQNNESNLKRSKKTEKKNVKKHSKKEANHFKAFVATAIIVICCVAIGGVGLYFSDDIASAFAGEQMTVNFEGTAVTVDDTVVTVGDFLQFVGRTVEETDIIQPGLNEQLIEGMTITVTKTIGVTLVNAGKSTNVRTTAATVNELLTEQGITVEKKDKVKPGLESKLKDGSKVQLIRITTKTVTEEEEIPFTVVESETKSLYEGETQVKQEGKDGLKKVTYEVTYENGKEVSRKEIKSETTTEMQNKVVLVGIKKEVAEASRSDKSSSNQNNYESDDDEDVDESSTSSTDSSNGFEYSDCFSVEATAYTYTGNNTACGTAPGVGTIAVDPDVIPLYSNLYVEGYGYGQALDTGGAINGHIIDVFFETESECINWGRRTVTVYILI